MAYKNWFNTPSNFSPPLGEYGAFGVRIVNAPADATEDFSFKLEIVREIENNGEQHIDLVPVGNGTAAESRPLDFTSNRFDWDGISSMTYSSAVNGRDSFQGVAASAVRVFPAVTAGQPVPPPFVTAVAKIICNSDSVTVCEARKRVCIPQVVKIEYDQASVDAILSGYISDNGTVFIQPIPSNSWAPCRVQIAMQAQAYYSAENVNVRFVDSTVSVQQPHTIMQMDGITQSAVDLGETPLPFDEMNTNPSQMGFLYYFGFRNSLTTWYQQQEPSLPHPNVTNDELVRLFARTATHETGHALGLVSSQLSGGGTGIWEYHNQFPFNFHLMDPGPEATLYQKMGRDGVAWTFNLWNSDYLRFILPRQ